MSSPFFEPPFAGALGLAKATIFRLDPTGTKPISPVGALVSRADPNRVSLDVVDTENIDHLYSVTSNPLQDFSAATLNVSRELIRMTISGLLVSAIDLPIVGSVGFPGLRTDLGRVDQIRRLADAKEPVMVITPRFTLPRAFIESLSRSWSPGDGESVPISISFVEARIVNTLAADSVIPDVAASQTGNNRTASHGGQAAQGVDNVTVTDADTFGVAPEVQPA